MASMLKIESRMMMMMMMMLVGFGMIGSCHAQSASNVYTTYNIYNPAASGYSLSGLYCDTQYGSQSYAWRSAFPWTAFCGPTGPAIDQACGQCLQVTNPSTGQSVKVRIVDQCSNGGLDLDQSPFNAIDGNGQGYAQGHMYTTYTFVTC